MPASSPPAPHRSLNREAAFALAAGFLGWTLDAFDYFLVVISGPKIMAEFHCTNADIQFSLFLTLAFRPIGALLFGLLADRYGRRIPMMIDLVFYSAVEVATGFAPNLKTFYICRALFGIGMGGEWGVGASLVMEKVPPRLRGVLSGFLQEGYAFGNLLSAVAAYFLLDRFGWRAMFFLGGAPALLALFIRFFVHESEVWQKSKAESWSHLGATLARHWKLWLYLMALMAMMNFSSHGTQDNYPKFLEQTHKMETLEYSKVVMVSTVGAILGGLVFGLASDWFGRRRMMVIAFTGALLAIPIWAFSHGLLAIMAGGFAIQFMVQGAWGIIPAHINELSPDQVRGVLPGFSYQCGNLLSSWIGWAQASRVALFGFPNVLAISAAVIFLIAIVVAAAGPERRAAAFGEDR
jgi:SHS family lactate transporter-like MFS transporter